MTELDVALGVERPSFLRRAVIRAGSVVPDQARSRLPGLLRGGPRGPSSVFSGLHAGLRMLGVGVEVFDGGGPAPRASTLGVLSGEQASREASDLRRRGVATRFALGPNVALLPSLSPDLGWADADAVLVPSEWVAELYERDMPTIAARLVVWPAGVDTSWWSPSRDHPEQKDLVLVYDKRNDGTAAEVARLLRSRGMEPVTVRYGAYQPAEYRALLQRSRALVWLGATESQALAMFEAWACDVPVIVVGSFMRRCFGPHEVVAPTAPYLSPDRGSLVESVSETADAVIDLVQRRDVAPRESLAGMYDLVSCASSYLAILTGRPVADACAFPAAQGPAGHSSE